MVTLSQRILELREERGLSRPGLAAALGFPKNSIEKFETGRQTPTKDQQDKLADYFGVSPFYLRGESNDRTRQETWMDAAYADDEPVSVPKPKKAPRPAPASTSSNGEGSMLGSLLNSKGFQELVRSAVLDALRSPEGEELVARAVRKELTRQTGKTF
jgi:transcriptional regulator with XRE-family HTH domain